MAVCNTPPALAFALRGLTQAVDAFTFTEGCMEVAKVASASSLLLFVVEAGGSNAPPFPAPLTNLLVPHHSAQIGILI